MFRQLVKLLNPSKLNLKFQRFYSPHNDPCGLPPYHSWDPNADGLSCEGKIADGSGLILGVYYDEKDYLNQTICLTKAAALFNHNINGKLVEQLKAFGPLPKLGEVRTFTQLDPAYNLVTVVGLGDNNVGYVKQEARDEAKENIRKAVGVACRVLQDHFVDKVYVEGFEDPESAAEGAVLALWGNQHLRDPTNRTIKVPDIMLYGDCDWKKWRIGLEKAEAQNFARRLMEAPGNLMTPRKFAYAVVQSLCKTSVNVTLRGEQWLRENNMNAFLTNTQGSPQPPCLLEIDYNGCDSSVPPIVLIGKGLTYNSGGLCLKTCDQQKYMRGDMAGGAVVVAAFKALANLGLPVNVRGLIPLGENMPGGTAGRPRDIVKSTSGKSILVANQDFDGNLLLVDTICYAQRFKPKYIVSLTTMSKEIRTSFDLACSGLFSRNEKLWQLLKISAVHSGDRLWKLPLWQMYEREIKDVTCSDLSNLVKYEKGLACSNAQFLNQFTCKDNWAHIDMFGVMYEIGKTPYLRRGMSGRPTRTLIEFLGQIAYPPLDIIEKEQSAAEETE
ncbi:cytosol aminopeptidase-like [Macrosteles quadrilineatus]|uniref:cytosol aminopeptidase-like n=1 Tax=Macrosteles quadrilineatus TaxID=74068 RepID=UPI0023E254FD|nr:cytosol aminopeptidase-like [Macrosteles quadrilineatus]